MDPSVKQRVALLLNLLRFSHSDSGPSAVSGLHPELQSDDHKLSAHWDFSTTCRERKNREVIRVIYHLLHLTAVQSDFFSNCLVHAGKLILNISALTSA